VREHAHQPSRSIGMQKDGIPVVRQPGSGSEGPADAGWVDPDVMPLIFAQLSYIHIIHMTSLSSGRRMIVL
jgi:hypothetical protein